jgi:carboxyl-terminal processing protease
LKSGKKGCHKTPESTYKETLRLVRKLQAGVLPALLILAVLGTGINWWWHEADRGRYRDWLTALCVMSVIKCQYYQPVSLNRLTRAYLKTGNTAGMLKILRDPYTRFLPRNDYAELCKETEGVFGGIGIFLLPRENQLTISSVVKGSPGERAGLLPGDRITAVDNIAVSRLGVKAALVRIKGPAGAGVKLGILRQVGAGRQELQIQITRRKIRIPTVALIFKNDSGIGQYAYLTISQFAATTARDLEQKLQAIKANRNCRGLILDLRGNPGGELEAALRIAGYFLPQGVPVLHIKRRNGLETITNKVAGRQNLPMAVLVDGASASASEIVAGALKDYKRAVLVGTHTFGKDLIQQITELPGKAAVSVTIASYLTSGKVNIHHRGVQPDYTVSLPEVSLPAAEDGSTFLNLKIRKLQEATAVRILQKLVQSAAQSGQRKAG